MMRCAPVPTTLAALAVLALAGCGEAEEASTGGAAKGSDRARTEGHDHGEGGHGHGEGDPDHDHGEGDPDHDHGEGDHAHDHGEGAGGGERTAGASEGPSGEMPAPEATIGEEAPDFTLPTASETDREVSLSDLEGRIVVLEWYNPDCPFVEYAHTDGPLADMASRQPDDVAWLAINSNAEGKQGHGAERNAASKETYGFDHPVLLDEDGKVGKAYGATNSPQMYVIDAQGVLRYRGALDNAPFGRKKGATHKNYVARALEAVRNGREVGIPTTKPYGCSVKYAD